jgi:hypothetical protein
MGEEAGVEVGKKIGEGGREPFYGPFFTLISTKNYVAPEEMERVGHRNKLPPQLPAPRESL